MTATSSASIIALRAGAIWSEKSTGVQFTVAQPQHRSYFFPEPHGHASFRWTLGALGRGSLVWAPETDIIRALYYVWRSRAGPRELKHRTT